MVSLGCGARLRGLTVPIRAILETDYGPVFGPEEVAILAAVFDATLKTLGLVDRKDPMTTAVARLIIQIAREDGERDPKKPGRSRRARPAQAGPFRDREILRRHRRAGRQGAEISRLERAQDRGAADRESGQAIQKSQRQKASGAMMTLRMSAWWSPLQETGIDGWNIRTHVWEQRLRTIRFLARPTDRHRDYDRGVGVRGRGRSDPSGGGATRLARRQWNASHRRDAQGCEPAARRHHRHRDWRGRADLRGGGRCGSAQRRAQRRMGGREA